MFIQDDTTYNDIREKSLLQWLDEMEKHEDVAVRTGVRLAKEYIGWLKEQKVRLEEENRLKNEYLKKIGTEYRALKKQVSEQEGR